MRDNLIARLKARETIFPGIVGYEDTVVPQIVNAVLSRQNFILLGLRGQAKSRILRALTALLDEQMPYVAGCEIRDNPYRPLCRRCRDLIAEKGDATPIAYLSRDERYVEKLATPDVTVADLIGDLDPIKAARGGQDLSSELTMHYGLLPRANRGIFAINELPDLAGKIQVALFNIMQEGDVQIKGYPVRLALDVALVFSANPEDYTARGKIVTPLKDRIGSEIRTHYPETLEEGMAITAQEAWAERGTATDRDSAVCARGRGAGGLFRARRQEGGQAQRREPAAADFHDGAGGFKRRAARTDARREAGGAARRAIIYAALPGITGKLELEYEGEMRGADTVVRELIRTAVGKIYDRYFADDEHAADRAVVQPGRHGQARRQSAGDGRAGELKQIQGLMEKLDAAGHQGQSDPARGCGGGRVSAGGHGGASQAQPQRGARLCGAGEGAQRKHGTRWSRRSEYEDGNRRGARRTRRLELMLKLRSAGPACARPSALGDAVKRWMHSEIIRGSSLDEAHSLHKIQRRPGLRDRSRRPAAGALRLSARLGFPRSVRATFRSWTTTSTTCARRCAGCSNRRFLRRGDAARSSTRCRPRASSTS